jgi:hypothetical protein
MYSQNTFNRDGDRTHGTRFAGASESSAANAIVGVAMVGLLGGGPRLAMRAARVVLTDCYGARSQARDGRLRSYARHRGD